MHQLLDVHVVLLCFAVGEQEAPWIRNPYMAFNNRLPGWPLRLTCFSKCKSRPLQEIRFETILVEAHLIID